MTLEDLRGEIDTHPDFRDEKSMIETFVNRCGHGCIMLPKFHCELETGIVRGERSVIEAMNTYHKAGESLRKS